MDSHYDTLGIPRDASETEIRSAYLALAKALHPDKNPFGAQLFKRINEAHEVLSEKYSRQNYDRTGYPPNSQPDTTAAEKKREKRDREADTDGKDSNSKKPRTSFVLELSCFVCEKLDSKSLETSCCGRICCKDCAKKMQQMHSIAFICPGKECPTKHSWELTYEKIPKDWRVIGKFLCQQIDRIAPKHFCGQNVLDSNLKEHEKVCPKLNAKCIKCKGIGQYTTGTGTKVKCDACKGSKLLSGLNWSRCFKCSGRGAYNTVSNTCVDCDACSSIGALHGNWEECFKCSGRGAFETVSNTTVDCTTCHFKGALQCGKWIRCFKCNGCGGYNTYNATERIRRINCSTCNASGALRGLNWMRCAMCRGLGGACTGCMGRGVTKCMCRSNCNGHPDYPRPSYMDSDSDSDSD